MTEERDFVGRLRDAREALDDAAMGLGIAVTNRIVAVERERDRFMAEIQSRDAAYQAMKDGVNEVRGERDAALAGEKRWQGSAQESNGAALAAYKERDEARQEVLDWKETAAQWEKTAKELRAQLDAFEIRGPAVEHDVPPDLAYLKAQLDEQAVRIQKLETSESPRERQLGKGLREALERIATLEAAPVSRNALKCKHCDARTIYWAARMPPDWRCIQCGLVQETEKDSQKA